MTKHRINRLLPYLLIILFAVLILLPQIHSKFFLSGMDYYFHMSRTYETAMQIKTNHFSYFLSLFSWQRSARIVNALYGPLGGYISGLLLLITKTWLRWEISFYLIILIISGVSMHQLNRYWRVNPVLDVIITFLYMLSPAVFSFVFWQSFYGVGAAFMPWVFLAGAKIANGHVDMIKLIILMTVIAEIHLLSLILASLVIGAFVLFTLIFHKHRLAVFLRLFASAILTLILTFNVWGSLLEITLSNRHHLWLTYPNLKRLNANSFNAIVNTYHTSSLLQTPSLIGPVIFLGSVILTIIWLFKMNRHHVAFNVTMLLGIAFLLLSSELFPWGVIQRHLPLVDTLVQFSGRFLSIGLIGIYLIAGKVGTEHRKHLFIPMLIILLLAALNIGINNYRLIMIRGHHFYTSAVIDWRNMHWNHKTPSSEMRRSLVSDHPGQFINMIEKPAADYLPTSMRYSDTQPRVFINYGPYYHTKRQLMFHYHRSFRYRVQIEHRAEEAVHIKSKRDQKILLPFVKYRHTVVKLNGRLINPRISKVGAVYVPLRAGNDVLTIYYQPNVMYQIGMFISIVVWILIVIMMIAGSLIKRYDPKLFQGLHKWLINEIGYYKRVHSLKRYYKANH